MDKGAFLLPDLMKIFQTYNMSEGKSHKTIIWYDQAFALLMRWLTEQGRPVSLGSVTEYTVREFILFFQALIVRGHKIKVGTVNNRVRALRSFFNFLYREGYNETNILQNLKPPKLPMLIVDILEDEEIKRIMACLDCWTTSGSRDIAILTLFLDTGIRLSELLFLKLIDVHLEEQYIKVMGKGSKERMIAFGSATKNALFNYLIHFRGEPAHPGIDTFFLSTYGCTMSEEGVRSMFRRVGALAGVPRLHPHLCRHTYATNFLINGGNVLLLKQNLGHTTLTMVDRYVHLATSRAAIMSKGFSPMDKLNIRGLRRANNRDKDNQRNGPPVFRQRDGFDRPGKKRKS